MSKLLLTPHDLSDEETIFHKYRLRDNLDLQKALESTYPTIKFDWTTDLQTLHVQLLNGVEGLRSVRDDSVPVNLELGDNFSELDYPTQKQKVVDSIFRYVKDFKKIDSITITIYFRYFQVCPATDTTQAFIKLKIEGWYHVSNT